MTDIKDGLPADTTNCFCSSATTTVEGDAPMQQPEGINGGGVHGIPNNTMDINGIPANMVALFQQFLASMANKDETKGISNQ
jgi:hypothetical protein